MIPFRTIVTTLALSALMPGFVLAQGTQEAAQPESERRPYRGLFGGLESPNSDHSLNFVASLFAAYDDNLLAGLSGQQKVGNPRLYRSGGYAGATAGLNYNYSYDKERFGFSAQAGTQLHYFYYDGSPNEVAPNAHAGVNVRYGLTRSTTISAHHHFTYSNNYRFLMFAGLEAPSANEDLVIDDGAAVGDPDTDLFETAAFRNTSGVAINQDLSRYMSVGAGYSYRSVNFTESDEDVIGNHLRDYSVQSASVRAGYRRPMTRHATLNLGYALRVAERTDAEIGEPRAVHHIRAGVDYSRALSFSRRTYLSFSTGSAMAMHEAITPEAAGNGSRNSFRLTGMAALTHEMGRTWTARASYFRGFVYREAFAEPYFTDSAAATVNGLITRRLSFSATAAWAFSKLDRPGSAGHTAFSATANSTFALNRYLALFARYVYYEYQFDDEVPLDSRFPRALERNGVRVGLTASVPLIR